MNNTAPYLQPNRLADVLALVQVLAFDRETYRSGAGLKDELQRLPANGSDWCNVAREHPEFFRVRNSPDKQPRVALIARYVLPHVPTADGDEKRPPLEQAQVAELMKLAISLHDKQLERKSRWKTWIPIIAAVIAAIAAISSAFIGLYKPEATKIQPPASSSPKQ